MPHRALGSVGGSTFDLDLTNLARRHDSGEWARAALAPAHVIVVCTQSPREEHAGKNTQSMRINIKVNVRAHQRSLSAAQSRKRSAAAQPRSGWLRSGDQGRAYRN
jgi:hypothetical protein